MDLKHLNLTLRTAFCLLVVFSINASGQLCTTETNSPVFKENNTIGQVVAEITVQDGVTMNIITNPEEAFGLNGTNLVAVKVLDYETLDNNILLVEIQCTRPGETSPLLRIIVTVEDINDNPPVFAQSHYQLEVPELSPIGTSVEKIEATDLDKFPLNYTLHSPMGEFRLQSYLNPLILVNKNLDYDTTPEVSLMLYVEDSPPPVHTASATITVTIIDINNRPPWFQPCTETLIGISKICLNTGYQGTVNLTEQATEALTLEPGPVHAIDGDKGRNDPINYRLLSGNEDGIFSIDPNSGDITMLKAVDVAGPIVLTVMAYEQLTPDMFATTTVTLQVVIKSLHPPKFVKSSYEGFISEDADVGSMVLESKNSNKPLQVLATDDDFADGKNPSIAYEVVGSNDFRITTEGFILIVRSLAPGTADLQMRVADTTNGEFSTASLSVEVTPGVPTTTMDMPTTAKDTITSPEITEMVTGSPITTEMATVTPVTTETVTELTKTSFDPVTMTSSSGNTNSLQTDGLPGPGGEFGSEDMAALGATLAVVLLICLVIIGVLVYRVKRNSSDWKKLSEASIFRSTLNGGSAGPKDGVQYINDGFQGDEDKGSLNSKEAAELPLPQGPGLKRSVPEELEKQSSAPVPLGLSSSDTSSPPEDSSSLSPSDTTDSEKEVKPILTKERRMEDGYKAVWFKQDIDPSVKEEVVIIPDSGEMDVGQEDDDNDDDEEEEEEEGVTGMNRFARRSGSDSEDEETMTSDL
uniref:Cadherin-related family member 5 n=1 Tax=Astyanax mexicanus TaxID=7994 RepID=W5LBB5_ASTMX